MYPLRIVLFASFRNRAPRLLVGTLLLFFHTQTYCAQKLDEHSAGPLPDRYSQPAAWCSSISRYLPSVAVALCQEADLKASGDYSVRGYPLMMRDAPPTPAEVLVVDKEHDLRPIRVLLLGGIHGDERTSAAIVFKWMQWLPEPEASSLHWHIVPVVNPDGLLASPPQRVNSRGVDLNRNFPTSGWATSALRCWNQKTGRDPRRFPGSCALSEPETRWLYAEIENFQPDVIISIHAPHGILDYDGDAKQPRRFGSLGLSRLGVYPGSLGNFGAALKGVPVVTIELRSATTMPSDSEQRKIWDDMLVWMNKNILPKADINSQKLPILEASR